MLDRYNTIDADDARDARERLKGFLKAENRWNGLQYPIQAGE
jgi:hypothetical protein